MSPILVPSCIISVRLPNSGSGCRIQNTPIISGFGVTARNALGRLWNFTPPSRSSLPSGISWSRICRRMRSEKAPTLILMAPISTGRPVSSSASSTRRKYQTSVENIANGRSATRPPKCRSSVNVMSDLCTNSFRYGCGMVSGSITSASGTPTPERAYT
jgi:hypothetical protein